MTTTAHTTRLDRELRDAHRMEGAYHQMLNLATELGLDLEQDRMRESADEFRREADLIAREIRLGCPARNGN